MSGEDREKGMDSFLRIDLSDADIYEAMKDIPGYLDITTGASAVLVYGTIKSPLAQPRNLVGGHVLSGLIGVVSYQLCHSCMWLAAAIAVATAISLMHATKTLHPPGGATALIAVIGGDKIHNLGYLYPIVPVGLGAVIMLAIALPVNNLPRTRRYPEYWI